MMVVQYVINGKLYHASTELSVIVLELATKHELFAQTSKTKEGFVIEAHGEKKAFLTFEPELFKKIASLLEIRLYTKNELPSEPADLDKTPGLSPMSETILLCAQNLRQEKVIALKCANGFHLVCNASKQKAVQTLRAIIKEPTKPLPIMFKNIQRASQLIMLTPKEETLLKTPSYPFVVSNLRILHRLEKVRYKHKLTPLINPISQKITLSLAHDQAPYLQIFEEVGFALVSLDAVDENGVQISDKETLIKHYGDVFEMILETDAKIASPTPRQITQITYGRTHNITPHTAENPVHEGFLHVCLGLTQSTIGDFTFKSQKILRAKVGESNLNLTVLSLLFDRYTLDQVLKQNRLPFSDDEIRHYYTDWESAHGTYLSPSLITLFDAIVGYCGVLEEKSFEEESLMIAERDFLACEENLLSYEIKEKEISIDLAEAFAQNQTLTHLSSGLMATISEIIAHIAQKQKQDLYLSGALFECKALTELVIEKLEENSIKAVLPS